MQEPEKKQLFEKKLLAENKQLAEKKQLTEIRREITITADSIGRKINALLKAHSSDEGYVEMEQKLSELLERIDHFFKNKDKYKLDELKNISTEMKLVDARMDKGLSTPPKAGTTGGIINKFNQNKNENVKVATKPTEQVTIRARQPVRRRQAINPRLKFGLPQPNKVNANENDEPRQPKPVTFKK